MQRKISSIGCITGRIWRVKNTHQDVPPYEYKQHVQSYAPDDSSAALPRPSTAIRLNQRTTSHRTEIRSKPWRRQNVQKFQPGIIIHHPYYFFDCVRYHRFRPGYGHQHNANPQYKKQVTAETNSASTFASTVDLIKKNHVNLGSAPKLPMNHTPTEF